MVAAAEREHPGAAGREHRGLDRRVDGVGAGQAQDRVSERTGGGLGQLGEQLDAGGVYLKWI